MSAIAKTMYGIRSLAEASVTKNAKKLAAQVQTLPGTATAIPPGALKTWILELTTKWPDAKAIEAEPDVFRDDVTELLLELHNHDLIDDGDMGEA